MSVRPLAIGVVAAALMAGPAAASDFFVPSTPQPFLPFSGFGWEGLYVGVQAGALFNGDTPVGTQPAGTVQGTIGGVVGVNFIPVDPILVGLEVQGDYVWGSNFDAGLFLLNARLGAVVTNEIVVYATGGLGTVIQAGAASGVYALGGGVEYALTDSVSLRGEVLGLGDFNAGTPFFQSTRATLGAFYHF